MARSTKYPQEIRERAVRIASEHEPEYPSQWATIRSVSSKFGMSAETLRSSARSSVTREGICRRSVLDGVIHEYYTVARHD